MASEAGQAFQAYMESKDMTVRFLDDDEQVARTGFNLDNTTIEVLLFFGDDDKDVHFEGRDFVKIPADKRDMVYKLCNQCNSDYRWVKFVWKEDSECVAVQADAVIEPSSCAQECFEILMRICGIVEETYPMFMKAIWA